MLKKSINLAGNKTLLIVLPLLFMAGCSKPINESTLIKRGEHMYEANATKPFSGSVFELHENGETAFEGNYKDGFKHGDWSYFTKLGSGQYEVGYTAGSYNVAVFTDDKGTTYTGSPITEEPTKDGTYLFQEKQDKYDFSKFPFSFGMVTHGKKDGDWTIWDENGQLVTPPTDINGNLYQIVRIGDQVWMEENLKVTHYRNGDAIPTGHSNSEWENLSTGAYAVYNGNESNADTYGYLYNWFAVDDSRNIAPEGWHVPTDDEWKELEMHLGMSQSEADDTGCNGTNEGSKLAGNADLWNSGALENNSEFGSSGFTALPGGYRDGDGHYNGVGNGGTFWSSTEGGSHGAWHRILFYGNSDVNRGGSNKHGGFSVRCIRD